MAVNGWGWVGGWGIGELKQENFKKRIGERGNNK